jgi:methylmalonyl-CoA mutase C-terminal domain/subunit
MEQEKKRKIKILLAKPGLDGHSVGIRMVARAFRDQGFEVVFLGIRQKNEAIINAAVQEDADVIGLSVLSGAHLSIMRDFMNKLERDGTRPLVIMGGVIPAEDYEKLYGIGVNKIFNYSQSFEEMGNFILEQIGKCQ